MPSNLANNYFPPDSTHIILSILVEVTVEDTSTILINVQRVAIA